MSIQPIVWDEKMRPRIGYALIAMGVRHDEVEDCTQDVILALLEARMEIRDQAHYALGIARNVAWGEIRRVIAERARAADIALVESTMPSHEPGILSQLERRETLDRANLVLRTMPFLGRQILTRFYFDGQGAADICRDLEISATVFRLNKWRSKAMFVKRVRACVQ